MSTQNEKPFDASYPNKDRYGVKKGSESRTVVMVDGVPLPGTVLGRNGPRTQVRFVSDDGTFVRWFDSADLLDAD